jgi:hypothetical protein
MCYNAPHAAATLSPATAITGTTREATMDNLAEWTDQLLEAEQQLADAYDILAKLQAELKAAGRKKDMQAIGEVVERLARYGRLFEDIRQSWTEATD